MFFDYISSEVNFIVVIEFIVKFVTFMGFLGVEVKEFIKKYIKSKLEEKFEIV